MKLLKQSNLVPEEGLALSPQKKHTFARDNPAPMVAGQGAGTATGNPVLVLIKQTKNKATVKIAVFFGAGGGTRTLNPEGMRF